MNYKTLLGCLIFVVLWSSGWIGSKYGQDYAGTFTLLVYRYILVVLLLAVFVTFSGSWRRISPNQFILHVLVGILSHAVYLGTGNSALILGVSAGLVAFITALQPLITATMSSSISGEQASYRQWFGLAVGFGAIMMVISDKIALGGSVFAYSLPFVAIVAISLASLLDRRISLQNDRARVEPTPLSLVSFIHSTSALIVMVPFAYSLEGFEADWGSELIFSIVWLALVVSLGAYGMMFFMLRRISAIKIASLEYLAPPTTMIIAYFMFDERLSMVDFGGICLAGFAVWLVVSNKSRQKHTQEHAPNKDNLLRRATYNTESLAMSSEMGASTLSLEDIDIELGENALSKRYITAEQGEQFSGRGVVASHHAQSKELLSSVRIRESSRLNLLWEKLRRSEDEVKSLHQALVHTEHENSMLRIELLEYRNRCERLQDTLKR